MSERTKYDIKITPVEGLKWPTPKKDGVVISSERGVVTVPPKQDKQSDSTLNEVVDHKQSSHSE